MSDSCRLAVEQPRPYFPRNGDDWQGGEDVPRLTGLSFAHPVVPSGDRAFLSFEGGSLRGLHRRLRAAGHEAFLLSTCLRVEIVWPGPPDDSSDVLGLALAGAAFHGVGLNECIDSGHRAAESVLHDLAMPVGVAAGETH